MDLLSALLRELRLESAAYRLLELHAPWRLRFDGGLRGVHVVVGGRCRLSLAGIPVRELRAGDLVVLPRADDHELASTEGDGPAVSSLELARRTPGTRLLVDGPGEVTTLVCGAFTFGDLRSPAVDGFPRLIHLRGLQGRPPPWLAALTDALVAEVTGGGPGSEVVLSRLSDALVTRALRAHLESADEPGLLRGMHDPPVARALAALLTDLAAPWTLPALARAAGLSRAAFAARFTASIGTPPMRYLHELRMARAAGLLETSDLTVAAVAARVGYGSESAFTTAFSRWAGRPPGRYRRQRIGHRPLVPSAQ